MPRLIQFAVVTLTIALPVSITIVDVFGYVARVDGISMQPALNPDVRTSNIKDYVLLNKWMARSCDFKRGEIVTLISPSNPEEKLIKRIVALEGDTVKTLSYKDDLVTIPAGHCWVEGDHHTHSRDSNAFGPIAVALITAKASRIVWPPGRWQKLTPRISNVDRVTS